MSRWRHFPLILLLALAARAAADTPAPTPQPTPAETKAFAVKVEAPPGELRELPDASARSANDAKPALHVAKEEDGTGDFSAPASSTPSGRSEIEGEHAHRRDYSAPQATTPSTAGVKNSYALAPLETDTTVSSPSAGAVAFKTSAATATQSASATSAAAASVAYSWKKASSYYSGSLFSPGGRGKAALQEFERELTFCSSGIYFYDFVASSDGKKLLTDSIVAPSLRFDTSDNAPFILSLATFNAKGQSDVLSFSLFDASRSYSWTLVETDSLRGFRRADFFIDTKGFLNDTKGGTFAIARNGDSLVLNFTPVPEPSTWVLMITGLATVLGITLRRRR